MQESVSCLLKNKINSTYKSVSDCSRLVAMFNGVEWHWKTEDKQKQKMNKYNSNNGIIEWRFSSNIFWIQLDQLTWTWHRQSLNSFWFTNVKQMMHKFAGRFINKTHCIFPCGPFNKMSFQSRVRFVSGTAGLPRFRNKVPVKLVINMIKLSSA